MPSELGPIGPTAPWNPGAEYLQVTVTTGTITYEDSATVYLDLSVYVTEEYPVVYFDLRPISTVETAQFVDAATIYLDLSLTGGECFSSSSGINLDAEAWARWYADAVQRWEAEEFPQWVAQSDYTQFLVTEDDVNLRWLVTGISTTDHGC